MRSCLLLLFLALTVNSCIPTPTDQGICKTSEGDVKTYNVIGVWKKDPKTAKEAANFSAGNFRLLYIVQGASKGMLEGEEFDNIEVYYNSEICEKVVSNGFETKITKAGLYFHDDGRSRIKTNMLNFEEEDPENVEELVKYRFTGSCNGTKLHLIRGSGDSEKIDTYTFFASNPPTNSCNFEGN